MIKKVSTQTKLMVNKIITKLNGPDYPKDMAILRKEIGKEIENNQKMLVEYEDDSLISHKATENLIKAYQIVLLMI